MGLQLLGHFLFWDIFIITFPGFSHGCRSPNFLIRASRNSFHLESLLFSPESREVVSSNLRISAFSALISDVDSDEPSRYPPPKMADPHENAGRVLVQELREISQTQYDKGNFDLVLQIMHIAINLSEDNWELYRLRGRAYKRLYFYHLSISDYKTVLKLNSNRERAHLTIVESFILLKDYSAALNWIKANNDELREEDVRTFFKFFSVVCLMLRIDDYRSEYSAFVTYIRNHPLSKFYREEFWSFDPLIDFVGTLSIPEQSRNDLRQIIHLIRNTSR